MAEITFGALAIDCPDPRSLADFYSKLLGAPMSGEDAIELPDGTEIWFQPVEDYQAPTWPSQERGQHMHLDITVDNVEDIIEKVLAHGGQKAATQPGEQWTVMLDPAGHPFCLMASGESSDSGHGRWTSLTIDTADGEKLSSFYHELFGMERTDHGGGFFALAAERKPAIYFQPVEDYQAPTWPTQERGQQMHIDFMVDDMDASQAHAVELGAKLVDDGQDSFHVLLDPDGHPFCLCRKD